MPAPQPATPSSASSSADLSADLGAINHPPGYRLRRGQNWVFLGLTYASYYLCRNNLGLVAPELKSEFGFSNTQYGQIQTARNGAYAVGQFINGLFTDRMGGKRAMTVGAVGTILLNLLFGLVAWSNLGWLFFAMLLIRLADGYVQAFGAPGMVKINTAWFHRQERGTFAGIFGFMINLGDSAAGQLRGLLATGFAVPLIFFAISVPKVDWRYMFIVPPFIALIIVVLMNLLTRNHPEEAGYRILHDDEDAGDDPHAVVGMGVIFRRITSNPIVWIVASAYFCTGFVRTAIKDWWVIYMKDVWSVEKGSALFWWMAVILLPFLASAASLGSGLVSDKLFGGRRAPVAALLYLGQLLFSLLAIALSQGMVHASATTAAAVILAIHVACNATHSILGTAAPMDLGGRKMAGFAAGVIDSFQYFGAMFAGWGLGSLLDIMGKTFGHAHSSTLPADQAAVQFNPTVWFAAMIPFGVLGTSLMTYLWWRHHGTDARGT